MFTDVQFEGKPPVVIFAIAIWIPPSFKSTQGFKLSTGAFLSHMHMACLQDGFLIWTVVQLRPQPALILLLQKQPWSLLVGRHRWQWWQSWQSWVCWGSIQKSSELQMSGGCEDWAQHLHPRGSGGRAYNSKDFAARLRDFVKACDTVM